MPQSLANILVHLVFSTKDRAPTIGQEIRDELHRYLSTACRTCGCPALRVGGTADHVHMLFSLSRTTTVADVVQTVKADSSKWAKTKGTPYEHFSWQAGYGAFSISQSQVGRLTRYIAEQVTHHTTGTFQDEFRALLRKYEIEYDERYVWD